MNAALALAALLDAAFVAFVASRVVRSRRRGLSLRLRLFLALGAATLAGALATGLYATAVDARTLGFSVRFAQVAPKGFLLASALLPFVAAAAAFVGGRLARPVEELSEAAARIAENGGRQGGGEAVRAGHGAEAQKLARALSSMRRELADRPYAAAFLRDAWHDLKTPVAALVATLEVLEDGALHDPEAAPRFLANLRGSVDRLDRLLQDLVTLARFETAALPKAARVDLRALADRATDAVGPLAQARGVTLTVSAAERRTAYADDAALARALGNLLENAVKASPGGEVRVVVREGEGRGLVAVEVSNGPASIPAALRDHLFERSVAARASEKGGDVARERSSGLGLAIARAAVEANGGTVRFTELGPPRVVVRIELPADGG